MDMNKLYNEIFSGSWNVETLKTSEGVANGKLEYTGNRKSVYILDVKLELNHGDLVKIVDNKVYVNGVLKSEERKPISYKMGLALKCTLIFLLCASVGVFLGMIYILINN